MLHKTIHAIRQLKRKGNTNTSSAPKHQCKSSYLSNFDLKTNEISFDKTKAVKPTSKAHSTRCFKCHRIGHYANKCQKQEPLVTLDNENLETEPEKEEPLPIQTPDQSQGEHCADYGSFAYNPFPFNVSDLMTNLFEEEGNDVPQFMDQSIGANQNGDQTVQNSSAEVRLPSRTAQDDRAMYRLDPLTSGMKFRPSPRPEDQSDRTSTCPSQPSRKNRVNSRARLDLDHARLDEDYARLDLDHTTLDVDHATLDVDHARLNEDHARLDLDHARLDLGGEETEDGHAFSSGGPSRQSHKRPYRCPVHPSGSDEPGHLD
uniref:CCHC-type domain-containing protein n=1 Tax=Brassica oleracea var. oleracea TaxID=109376 RepID=A0A0D3BHA9_BRAOL